MKRLLIFAIITVLCLSGCSKEDKAKFTPSGTVLGVEDLNVAEEEDAEVIPSEELTEKTQIQYEAVLSKEAVNSSNGNATSKTQAVLTVPAIPQMRMKHHTALT